MTAVVYQFHHERAIRRPYANLGTSSLRELRTLNARQGNMLAVSAIAEELRRRESADSRLRKAAP